MLRVLSKLSTPTFRRPQAAELEARLREPRRFIQVVAGPRQVGKTTLVQQVLADLARPTVYASADEPSLRDRAWLAAQWERGRGAVQGAGGAVLALDEVHKVPGWSETVKRLWDEDTAAGRPLQVVLLGSSPMLVHRGLTESLAGRFEILRLPHWSYGEMHQAFGLSLEAYVLFGGYPGAAPLVPEPPRWRRYVLDALVETTIARDVLLLQRVDKPALLRRLFELGCRYSGQILSYTKILGQLQEAGNATTLAHYLHLLAGAGMLTGLQKYAGQAVRRRASSPKWQVLNTALLTAESELAPEAILADPELWGRWLESAVGAHLANAALRGACRLYYWRHRNREVDFVVEGGGRLLAIEVKSGRTPAALPGLTAFTDAFPTARPLLVGGDGIPLEEFLRRPVEAWLAG
ncbi:MAG: ATP-binding protein [Nitrospirae bacterium]|nr:MAG: ATP-binding protein [Nitrospirota bacterium]